MSISVDESYKHSKEIAKLETRRRTQLDEIRASHNGQLKSKDESFEQRIDNLKEGFSSDRKDTINSYNVQLDSSKADVKEKFERISLQNQREISSLTKDFSKERLENREKFQSELKGLSEKYENIIKGKDRDIEDIKKNFEKRISKSNKRNQKEIDNIHETYTERIDELKEDQKREIKNLVKKYRSDS